MSHPNEELLSEMYQRIDTEGPDGMMSSLADDIVWHPPGSGDPARTIRGKQAVAELQAMVWEVSGGTLKIEVHDLLANDKHAVALVQVSGEREGKSLNQNVVHVWHVEGGKLTEFWSHPQDTHAFGEFFS